MWTDEIVEEIHQIREQYAKSFNYDLDAIFADLRKKQAESGREIVNLSRKPGLIGIGRILTNPPSHTTRQAAPHRAVPNLSARQTD
jgi:hypothetical protein